MKKFTQRDYQLTEAKLRTEADAESSPMLRERLLVQAEAWQLLARASCYISEQQDVAKLQVETGLSLLPAAET
jgi:hypothetical protein